MVVNRDSYFKGRDSSILLEDLIHIQSIVTSESLGRMLLSHNFNLKSSELPALNREEFAQIFIDALSPKPELRCSHIQNPHWVVEILYPVEQYTAPQIGQLCGEVLTSKRISQIATTELSTDTLILGGKKTTPVTSNSPTSLQTGEWGVDVVETAQTQVFLNAINWDALTADKPSEGIFRIDFPGK